MVEWLKTNVSVVISIIVLASGGYASYIRLQDQMIDVRNKITLIERDGTEKTRTLEKSVANLQEQNNALAIQMKEQKEVLNKIDKRVGYLLCRQDKRFCVE